MQKRYGRNIVWSAWRQGGIVSAYHQPPLNLSLRGEGDELVVLRRRVQVLHQRVERIKQKIGEQKPVENQKVSAVVDEEECTGCGLCYEVCPTGAISVNRITQIDSKKCIVCLACVNRCPEGAIAIKYPNRRRDFLSKC